MSNSLQKMFRIPAALFARRIVYPLRKYSAISTLGWLYNSPKHIEPLHIQICHYKGNRRSPQKATSHRKKLRLPLKPQPTSRKHLENLTKKPPTPFSMRMKSLASTAPYNVDQTPPEPRKKWQNPEPPKPFAGAKVPITPRIVVFEDKEAVKANKRGAVKEKSKGGPREGIEVFHEDRKAAENEATRNFRKFLGGGGIREELQIAEAVPSVEHEEILIHDKVARRLKNLLKDTGSLKVHRDITAIQEDIQEEDKEAGKEPKNAVSQIVVDGNVESAKPFDEGGQAVKEDVVLQGISINETVHEENLDDGIQKASSISKSINIAGTTPIVTGGGGGHSTGDKDHEDGGGSDNSWRILKYSFGLSCLACACAFGYAVRFFGMPKVDTDGNKVEDEYSTMPVLQQYLMRALAEINYYNKMIKEPSRDKLLPDPLVAPYYQPPYTLVLEFTDVLVHPEWTYSTGWRFKKRPGLDQFLKTLSSKFELVVYTAEMGMTVFPIIEALDKNNLISYKLVRDATHFVDGHHVKDLDKLNRDLSKVVVVDWNPSSTKFHRENLFRIDRWDGNDQDTTLIDLTNFLNAISEWEIEDVRQVMKYYSQFKDPLATFRERQRELYAEEAD